MNGKAYPIKCRIRAAEDGVTRIDVMDDIGEGGWFSEGLTAKSFAAQMSGVKGALEVHINSAGGDVFDGIAIGNAIRSHKGPVTTVVDGLAASIASVIAQSGQDRVMQPGSMLMIHDAFGMCLGNAAEMAKMAETLGQVSDNLAQIYSDRAGGTQQDWRDAMTEEKWYTAEQAVAAGLADRVGDGTAELPAGLDLEAFTSVPGRIAARLRSMPQAKARNAAAHAPMTGAHSHQHPAFGSQGGDDSHEHEHSHDGDADHGHSHDGGDGAQDAAPRAVAVIAARPRILGVESMPLADKALPVHHTATVDRPWDGPAAVAAMPADDAVLRYCHAWEDADAAAPHREGDEGAEGRKQDYKFPHHATDGGPANLAACRNGLARLSSADIPAGDGAGVKAHLQAHLDDGHEGSAAGRAREGLSGKSPAEIRAALKALKGASE